MTSESAKKKYVYVVTYQDGSEEPVLTVFNNEEAASKCLHVFAKLHETAFMDRCPVHCAIATGVPEDEELPFTTEDLTLGSIVDNHDPGIIQRYLEFAKETGRDFHLTITAEGETEIDLTVQTKTVTESKYYSIPELEKEAGCDTCDWDQEAGHEHCKKCTRNFADEYKARV